MLIYELVITPSVLPYNLPRIFFSGRGKFGEYWQNHYLLGNLLINASASKHTLQSLHTEI
jgi:hypothetical protein